MKYSIIIPVYNVEKYISKCIDSIVNQTYKNIEIILVDDGSPDRSPEICDLYAKKDKRIKVIHKPNGGLVSARKAGIDIATGKYCLFVDSDDWIDKNTIEKINEYILKYKNADIVKFRFIYEPKKNMQTEYLKINHILSNNERKEIYKELLLSSRYNNLCNQVFRRDLYNLDDLVLDNRINYGEDLVVNLNIFYLAKKIVFVNDSFYHYFLNDDSITHNITIDNVAKNISDNILVNKERIKYITKYNVDVKEEEIRRIPIDFACEQILFYINSNKNYDFAELQKRISKTEIYNFFSTDDINDVKKEKWYVKKIKLCIINKEIEKLGKYILYFKFRKLLKRFKKIFDRS